MVLHFLERHALFRQISDDGETIPLRENRLSHILGAELDRLGQNLAPASPPWFATTVELVARLPHRASARADAPFVAINCGAIANYM